MKQYQHTLRETYRFSGKGLHTGAPVEMTILPAPDNYGIVFQRTDLGDEVYVEALFTNVFSTARSTCLKKNDAEVCTVEHLMAAFSGLNIDNALVQLNARELPILDGSAAPYVEAILSDGIMQQRSERRVISIEHPFEYFKGGSQILVLPSDKFEVDVEIDFNSSLLGRQMAHYDSSVRFASEIAPCRTFCFFRDLEPLLADNLIKGGDLDNAIVVVDEEVQPAALERLKAVFGLPASFSAGEGFISSGELHFPNECARHKLLDLMGDLALAGCPLKAKIVAVKPGHKVNVEAVGMLAETLSLK